MLQMTDIKLELMNDIDMFQLIKKGMRGGISNPCERCLRFVTAFTVRTDRKSKLRTESMRVFWT